MNRAAMEKMRILISKGYFPKELPLVFTTENFGDKAYSIVNEWRKNGLFNTRNAPKIRNKHSRDNYVFEKLKDTESEVISKPKRGFERRGIHITHPIPQTLLSLEISKNWYSIKKTLKKQRFSDDKIEINNLFDRGVRGINFSLHRRKKLFIESASDWLVKTDITRFYPTIYTHSIAWAMYDKSRVKSALGNYKGSLADRLDILVRACNRNQTIGIPVGPETSRVIAELISSRIDFDLSSIRPNIDGEKVDRLQDDWFAGVHTNEEAEQLISDIGRVYRKFGLEINGSKTSITRINARDSEVWVSEIGAFLSHRSGILHGSRLREFLAIATRLQKENNSEAVIGYSLSVLEKQRFSRDDVAELESFLLRSAVLSPVSLDRVCYMFVNLEHQGHRLSRQRIKNRFLELLGNCISNGYSYEILWILYTLRGLKIKLSARECGELSDFADSMNSSAIGLVLLDMKDSDLFDGNLPYDKWAALGKEDIVRTDGSWLLSYEGIRNGWLRDPYSVMSKGFFGPMSTRGIVFYDRTRNVRTIRSIVRDRVSKRLQEEREFNVLLMSLRGVDWAVSAQ